MSLIIQYPVISFIQKKVINVKFLFCNKLNKIKGQDQQKKIHNRFFKRALLELKKEDRNKTMSTCI